jgi:UDP-N-acetylglucosamine 4,6-dehydratase
MINNKRLLIFGGTGSLGYKLNERYCNTNEIYNYSRDENKHWHMKLHFNNNSNIKFIIGNVVDKERIKLTINSIKPDIIIIASAMKHIDQCETNTHESLNSNLLGTKYILDTIQEEINKLNNLNTVIFVSSDKACSPVNNYGMCKAISETLMVEKAYYIPSIKFITVRYGNVLNSRGSIVPLLHNMGKDINKESFFITHRDMTRFVMTLEQSVDLIEYAILNGCSGDIIIPELISMNVKDLVEIFSEIYNKPIKEIGFRPGEKMQESLINTTQSSRIIKHNNYIHIKSVFTNIFDSSNMMDYNSDMNLINKDTLKDYLNKLKLI